MKKIGAVLIASVLVFLAACDIPEPGQRNFLGTMQDDTGSYRVEGQLDERTNGYRILLDWEVGQALLVECQHAAATGILSCDRDDTRIGSHNGDNVLPTFSGHYDGNVWQGTFRLEAGDDQADLTVISEGTFKLRRRLNQ